MATSYSQDPDGQKNTDPNSDAMPENQQKASEVVAKNNAARRALPWVVVGVVVLALIVFAATRGLRSNNANTSSDASSATSTQGAAPASSGGAAPGSEGGVSNSGGSVGQTPGRRRSSQRS